MKAPPVGNLLAQALIATLAVCTASQNASAVTVAAADAGFFNAAGRSSKNDGVVMGASPATFNYSAGAIDEAPPLAGADVPRKNYFTFDLTSVTDTIVSATLDVFLPPTGFSSPEGFESYSLYGSIFPDVASMSSFASSLFTPYSIFLPPALSTATSIYAKLGDTKPALIPAFGTVTVTPGMAGSTLSIPISPTGLSYLNMFKGGLVVLSGELDTLNGVPGADEVVFGFSAPLIPGVVSPDPAFSPVTPTPTLTFDVVPEPSRALLAILGLGAGVLRRRRSR